MSQPQGFTLNSGLAGKVCREHGVQKKGRRNLYEGIIEKFNKVVGSEEQRAAAISTGDFVEQWDSNVQKLLASLFVDATVQRFKLLQEGHWVPFTVVSDIFCR